MLAMRISPKNMIMAAMGAAGLVMLAAVLDLAIGVPYNRAMFMDVMFLVSAGLVLYLAYDSYRELT